MSIKDKLLLYIFEMCKTGMTVNYILVLFRVASLSQSFCAKPYHAQYLAVERFMKHLSYTYRMGMHKSQRLPEEVANEVWAWVDHIFACLFWGPITT